MKNKLVCIGDSFLSDKFSLEKIPCDKTQLWHVKLAAALDLEYVNLAEDGVGNDWVVYKLAMAANDGLITKDDIVVLNLSHFDRKWITRNFAGASHLVNLSVKGFQNAVLKSTDPAERHLVGKQMQIAKDYYEYCYNPQMVLVEQSALIAYTHFLKELYGFDLLTIPTFLLEPQGKYKELLPPFNRDYDVSGWLNHTSISEFGSGDMDIDSRSQVRDKYFLTTVRS